MAFTPFNFTKSWRNASDFPTFEPDEAKVRDDLQSLFDELKVGLNRLIGELKASNMPFTPTAEVDSSDVQNAIENVQSQIASALLGQLPDGSVTSSKIADGSVDTGKIADGAITSAKLDDGVLPEAGEVVPLAPGTAAVGTSNNYAREDHVHPTDDTKADLSGGKVLPAQISKSRVNVSSSRNLSMTDDGKILYISAPVTVTIPSNSAVQLPVGSEIILYRAGTGAVTVDVASGVTLHCSEPLNSLKQYDFSRLKKWEANVWTLEINHDGISDAEVTTAKLANSAVTTEKISSGAVTGVKIADGGVSAEKIVDGAVSTNKIADNAVTENKIASNSVSHYFTASIDTTWVGSAAPFTKTVSVSGMLATDHPTYDVILSDTPDTAQAQIEEWNKIYKLVANNGSITLHAFEKPTVSLSIQLQCVRR